MRDGEILPFGDPVRDSPRFYSFFLQAANDGTDRIIGWPSAASGRQGRSFNIYAEDTDIGHIGGALNLYTGIGFDSNGLQVFEGIPGSGGGTASHLICQMFGEGGGTPKLAMIGSTGTAWQSLNNVGAHVPAFFTGQYFQFNYDSDFLLFDGTNITFRVQPSKIAFFGATPAAKPTVTGSKGANAALTSLLSALATLGLITDSST